MKIVPPTLDSMCSIWQLWCTDASPAIRCASLRMDLPIHSNVLCRAVELQLHQHLNESRSDFAGLHPAAFRCAGHLTPKI